MNARYSQYATPPARATAHWRRRQQSSAGRDLALDLLSTLGALVVVGAPVVLAALALPAVMRPAFLVLLVVLAHRGGSAPAAVNSRWPAKSVAPAPDPEVEEHPGVLPDLKPLADPELLALQRDFWKSRKPMPPVVQVELMDEDPDAARKLAEERQLAREAHDAWPHLCPPGACPFPTK